MNLGCPRTRDHGVMSRFHDRTTAGRELAAELVRTHYREPVVLALPRGGVPVAFEIAEALHARLGLILARKIGVPGQPEVAAGAVVDGDIVCNPDVLAATGMTEVDVRELARHIEPRHYDQAVVPVEGRTAIVVDDGIATGATMRVALQAVRRRNPAHLVLAVPVAPPRTLASLAHEVDEVVCLEAPRDFFAVGAHYDDFHQVSDDEVKALLERAK